MSNTIQNHAAMLTAQMESIDRNIAAALDNQAVRREARDEYVADLRARRQRLEREIAVLQTNVAEASR